MLDAEKKHSHAERMRRKKAVVDAAMERANEERGLFLVITGNGKGKSTSAFGTLYRALGHGKQAGVVQFIKGTQESGEILYLKKQAPEVDYYAMATGFTWNTQDWDKDKAAADQAWERAAQMLQNPALDLVVLDELTYMLKYRYLDTSMVLQAIQSRPPKQHLIVTGRGAKPELLEAADTVSEIRDIRHAFASGVKAQAGLDF